MPEREVFYGKGGTYLSASVFWTKDLAYPGYMDEPSSS